MSKSAAVVAFMIAIQTTARNGKVLAARLVNPEDEVMLITTGGVLIRTRVSEIREMSRATQGVTLINLGEDEKLAGLERVVETDDAISAAGLDDNGSQDAGLQDNGSQDNGTQVNGSHARILARDSRTRIREYSLLGGAEVGCARLRPRSAAYRQCLRFSFANSPSSA